MSRDFALQEIGGYQTAAALIYSVKTENLLWWVTFIHLYLISIIPTITTTTPTFLFALTDIGKKRVRKTKATATGGHDSKFELQF